MALLTTNRNVLEASLILENLFRLGVRHLVLCPGSRSSPLALAAAEHPSLETIIHFDERSAGFVALGIGKGTGQPAAVITTSGTAVAELLPSVVEASQSHVPMIILAADRPPELQGVGSNQTITQPGIFGNYVRLQALVDCPGEQGWEKHVLKASSDSYQASLGVHPGPAFMNLMFREPLAPTPEPMSDQELEDAETWFARGEPFAVESDHENEHAFSPAVTVELGLVDRGLIILGEMPPGYNQGAVLAFAEHMHWPVLPDLASQHRLGSTCPASIPHYDLVLSNPDLLAELEPRCVLQFGMHLVSKRLQVWLEQVQPEMYAMFTGCDDISDPGGIVTHQHRGDPSESLRKLVKEISPRHAGPYVDAWRKADRLAAGFSETLIGPTAGLTEPAAASLMTREAPEGAVFMASNSMPVRDVETFAVSHRPDLFAAANRGASGIDGILSTAVGLSVGRKTCAALLIGDLAALHDLNALALLKNTEARVVMVIINNDGGGIFRILPVAAETSKLEPWWTTPHGLDFKDAADMFGLSYAQPASLADFRLSLKDAYARAVSSIIEVKTDQAENVAHHKDLIRGFQEFCREHG